MEARSVTEAMAAGVPADVAMAEFRQSFTTSAELLKRDFAPERWVVDQLIPQHGLTLFASKMGNGKSFLMLSLAVAISTGGEWLGRTLNRAKCIYLGLEDSDRRLRKRLDSLEAIGTDNLFMATTWKRGPKAIEQLRLAIQMMPDVACIIIDPAARFLSIADYNDYGQVYEAIAELKAVANKVAIIMVHHCKKEVAVDAFDDALGSTGIPAACDNRLVLRRTRGKPEGTLYSMGKDLEYSELAIRQEASGAWTALGDAREVAMSEERRSILDLLEIEGPMSPKAVSQALEKNYHTTKNLLHRMADAGELYSDDGKYTLKGRSLRSPCSPKTGLETTETTKTTGTTETMGTTDKGRDEGGAGGNGSSRHSSYGTLQDPRGTVGTALFATSG